MHIYKTDKKRIIKALLPIVLSAAALIILLFGAAAISNNTREKREEQMKQAIDAAVVNCYATEGSYPPNIQYLKDHYGLSINDGEYIISYDSFADNIRPRISLLRKGEIK